MLCLHVCRLRLWLSYAGCRVIQAPVAAADAALVTLGQWHCTSAVLSTATAVLLQDNVDKITFYPGLSGSDLPFGTLTAVKVRSHPVAQHVSCAWAPSQRCWLMLCVCS